MNIYVGNLAYKMNDEDLKATFEAHGEVASARIIMNRETGRSKGFGFVEMPNQEQAEAAIEALHGTEIDGRSITVNEARPQQPRSGGGGGGRRGGYDR